MKLCSSRKRIFSKEYKRSKNNKSMKSFDSQINETFNDNDYNLSTNRELLLEDDQPREKGIASIIFSE